MKDCLFCKLATDSTSPIWENDTHVAIKDLYPKAATHLLIIPKQHIESLDHLELILASDLVSAIQQVVGQFKLAGAYRVQINVGRHGGQEIDHLHVHVLSDRAINP